MDSVIGSPVGFGRRLAAIVYDTLLIGISTALLGGLLATLVSQLIGSEIQAGSPLAHILFATNIAIAFGLVGWFWTHGGQTLGMRAWKIRVVTYEGHSITWFQALMRFAAALFGAALLGVGFWIAIFDPDQLAWHDRFSRTRLVRIG